MSLGTLAIGDEQYLQFVVSFPVVFLFVLKAKNTATDCREIVVSPR